MRYLLFICTDTEPDPATDDYPEVDEWFEGHRAAGVHVLGERLRPAPEARTVRVRGGERLVTDGPFAETRERIVGFDLIECDNMEQALEVAAGHPMAYGGRIEVRELWPFEPEPVEEG